MPIEGAARRRLIAAGLACAVWGVTAGAAAPAGRDVSGQAVVADARMPIRIEADRGTLTLDSTPDGQGTEGTPGPRNAKLRWRCRLGGPVDKIPAEPVTLRRDGQLVLDLAHWRDMRCAVTVPAGHAITVRLAQGQLVVRHPRYDLDAELFDGPLTLEPAPGARYRFDARNADGRAEASCAVSTAATAAGGGPAFAIRARATNGTIRCRKAPRK